MTLFDTLQHDERLQDTTSLVYLLLKRLAISEVIAGTKFKKTPTTDPDHTAVFEKITQKCVSLKADAVQTDAILTIFRQIVAIAGLIQAAWHEQSKNTKPNIIKEKTLALARSITSKPITENDLLLNIRECSAILTDQIITKLINLEEIPNLSPISPLLQACFPAIVTTALEEALATIKLKIDTLDSNHEYDMLDEEANEETKKDTTKEHSFCHIS
ncbi:MAG: hypothetical protein ACOYKA_02000 [Legionellaceae bacterium]